MLYSIQLIMYIAVYYLQGITNGGSKMIYGFEIGKERQNILNAQQVAFL